MTAVVCLLGCTSAPGSDDALGGAAGPESLPAAGAQQPSAAGAATPAEAGAGAGAAAAGSGGVAASGATGAAGAAAMSAAGASAGSAAAGSSGSGGAAAAIAGAGGASVPGGGTGAPAPLEFVLTPVGFPMAGDELTFPETANPPTNQSPEFTWTGVPAEAKSLALVFRDLGNGAVKWIVWDIPPTVSHLPPNLSKAAMPAEVPGSSQLGSLSNQGYAGPGSGARQYDFVLWALDVAKLPNTRGLTTAEIRMDILPMHDIATTEPILVRNTRNLR